MAEGGALIDRPLRSVFIGNVPYDITEERLREIFCEVGPVLNMKLVYDCESGKPKGYGFCEYKDIETALGAMRDLNGYEINGRVLRVEHAGSSDRARFNITPPEMGGEKKDRDDFHSFMSREMEMHMPPAGPEKTPEVIPEAVASLPQEQIFDQNNSVIEAAANAALEGSREGKEVFHEFFTRISWHVANTEEEIRAMKLKIDDFQGNMRVGFEEVHSSDAVYREEQRERDETIMENDRKIMAMLESMSTGQVSRENKSVGPRDEEDGDPEYHLKGCLNSDKVRLIGKATKWENSYEFSLRENSKGSTILGEEWQVEYHGLEENCLKFFSKGTLEFAIQAQDGEDWKNVAICSIKFEKWDFLNDKTFKYLTIDVKDMTRVCKSVLEKAYLKVKYLLTRVPKPAMDPRNIQGGSSSANLQGLPSVSRGVKKGRVSDVFQEELDKNGDMESAANAAVEGIVGSKESKKAFRKFMGEVAKKVGGSEEEIKMLKIQMNELQEKLRIGFEEVHSSLGLIREELRENNEERREDNRELMALLHSRGAGQVSRDNENVRPRDEEGGD